MHYFKHVYRMLVAREDEVLVTARDKEVTFDLLESCGIPYYSRGKGSNSFIGKLAYLPRANWVLLKRARSFRPDVLVSFSSPYAAQVSRLLRRPHIAFDDTENATLGRFMYRPFTDLVLSPNCYEGAIAANQECFNGFMELCYLHPNYFTPRPEVKNLLGLHTEEEYTMLRFVSWGATHDLGHKGLSVENKRRAVREFSRYGRVVISSEAELPGDMEQLRFKLSPDWMHDAMYFSQLMYGESATMASEAAMVGVPSIYLDDHGRGYTNQLEKEYGMVFNFSESEQDQGASIEKGAEILRTGNTRERFRSKHQALLAGKIDVTAYALQVIDRYRSR